MSFKVVEMELLLNCKRLLIVVKSKRSTDTSSLDQMFLVGFFKAEKTDGQIFGEKIRLTYTVVNSNVVQPWVNIRERYQYAFSQYKWHFFYKIHFNRSFFFFVIVDLLRWILVLQERHISYYIHITWYNIHQSQTVI